MIGPSIRVNGPHDGLYVIEFCGHENRSLIIFLPQHIGKDVLPDIQDRMPYGLQLLDPEDAV